MRTTRGVRFALLVVLIIALGIGAAAARPVDPVEDPMTRATYDPLAFVGRWVVETGSIVPGCCLTVERFDGTVEAFQALLPDWAAPLNHCDGEHFFIGHHTQDREGTLYGCSSIIESISGRYEGFPGDDLRPRGDFSIYAFFDNPSGTTTFTGGFDPGGDWAPGEFNGESCTDATCPAEPTCFGHVSTPGITTSWDPVTSRWIIVGTPGRDVIIGTDDADLILGGAGRDVICGRGGNDRINGGGHPDRIRGGPGSDVIQGSTGGDLIVGGADDDRIKGGAGNDQIDGGHGNDILVGGVGRDLLLGRVGEDRLADVEEVDTQAKPQDYLVGGPGSDVLVGDDRDCVGAASAAQLDPLQPPTTGLKVHLLKGLVGEDGHGFRDRLVGEFGCAIGTNFDDLIYANNADNGLYGLGGLDVLVGFGGDDFMRGGPGDDLLVGKRGRDYADGGPDRDTCLAEQTEACETVR